MKNYKLLSTLAIASIVLLAGCKKDDYVETIGVCPVVILTDPAIAANSVPYNKVITATFNEKMNAATITGASFIVQQGTTNIAGTVTSVDATASFTPSSPLLPFTVYKGTIKTSVKDLMGNALQKDYVWTFTTMAQITLLSNPIIGGITSGGGAYAMGATVTVTATPNVGYVFVSWTENGTVVSPVIAAKSGNNVISGKEVSTSSSYQFTMTGARTLTANFAVIVLGNFAINLSSNPAAGGTTSGNGTFVENSVKTVSATANTGYTFTNWIEGGLIVSTNSTFILAPLTTNRTLVANFLINSYNLTVNAVNGTVAKNPNQTSFNYGTSVILTPTPNTGYTFTSWSGDATGNANPLTVNMVTDKTITANFTIAAYTLVVISTNGVVVANPVQATYNYGSTVQLTATANAGYTFTSWSGDATGSTNPLTVTMNSNKNITANYTAVVPTYTLNVTAVNGIVVKNPNLASYASGASVILTATANTGYVFTGWSGDATGTVSPVTVIMNANKNVTANFALIGTNFTLNVTAVNGSVLKNPDLLSYASGASVILTASANSGYTFTGWSGDATGSVSPVTVVMNSNKNVTANFIVNVIPPLGPALIDLGCAAPFAILAGSTITNTGPSIITGNVGLSAGSALVGFPPGIIIGTQEITTPIAAAAKVCLTSAFLDGQGRSVNAISLPGNLGGLRLVPGLYHNSISSGISGTGANGILTLEGGANDVWIFQIGSTLTTDPATSIVLAGGAQAKNIFWIVGTSATLGTTSVFYGNILAQASITLNTGAVLNGRALTQIAAVSLDASTITKPQ